MISNFIEKIKLIKLLFKTNKFCLITITNNNNVRVRISFSNYNSDNNMEDLIIYLYCISLFIFKNLDGKNYDDKIETLALINSLIEGNIGRLDDDMQVLHAILKQFKIIMDLEND